MESPLNQDINLRLSKNAIPNQKLKPKSFLFLGDVIKLNGKNKTSLFDGYTIKKPNEEQIGIIKRHIDNYISIISFVNRFEHRQIPNKNGGHKYELLDEIDWNYWIIEHDAIQMDRKVPIVLSLSTLDLTVLFEGIYLRSGMLSSKANLGILGQELTMINFFHDNSFDKASEKALTELHRKELKKIHACVTAFESKKPEYDFIDKALQDFLRLKEISNQSPFKVLSYFSVLELLLTTFKARGSNDSSISSQLQKKINLINNQLDNKIDFQSFFKGGSSNTLETIIEKLYRYRNDIAHGTKSDFESELKVLKNGKGNILEFLNLLLKKILLKSIEEPQLIKDLKEC